MLKRTCAALLLLCPVLAAGAGGRLALPSVFGDGMVLQAGKDVRVWGSGAPGEKIRVTFRDRTAQAVADGAGRWTATIGPFEPGGPYELAVADSSTTLVVKDVMVGEVWFCSGQSNMAMSLGGALDGKNEAAKARDAGIRCFIVASSSAVEPQSDCAGKWLVCSPETAGRFPAAAYYFAVRLRSELNVPVGLVASAWGGTGIEAWMTLDAARGLSEAAAMEAAFRRAAEAAEKAPASVAEDDASWMAPDLDEKDWRTIRLPIHWDYSLHPVQYDGTIWARKKVVVPAEWAGRRLTLSIGGIDDFETTYFNGTEVGRTTSHTLKPRVYIVPAGLAKAGENTVAVCTRKIGWGGFTGPKSAMFLEPADDPAGRIDLSGEWKHRPSRLEHKGLAPFASSLHNAMVAPLLNLSIRGILWYQGEANASGSSAVAYRRTFPAMIAGWRAGFRQGDLPFYYVQLAAFRTALGDGWPLLRESQLKTLSVPKTGMAVAIDIGDPADIHPKNKKDVGERLALWALAGEYGKRVECSGPLFKSAAVEKERIRISFTHATGGLVARGGALSGFEIAGPEKKFVPATAVVDGETVVVSSPEVTNPVAARYAWKDYPEGCNLYNGAGLPASPFRTAE